MQILCSQFQFWMVSSTQKQTLECHILHLWREYLHRHGYLKTRKYSKGCMKVDSRRKLACASQSIDLFAEIGVDKVRLRFR